MYIYIGLEFQLYSECDCQFYWWRKPKYQEKTADLPQVADKLYHVHIAWVELEFTTFAVTDTDCIGSCKSNDHDGPYILVYIVFVMAHV